MEEETNLTKVILEIENSSIVCDKLELAQHSDYFKVMFGGNFVEHDKASIKLEGITLNSMNIILKLLWDMDSEINEEDIPSVLQASCMLQFIQIKNICVEKLINFLSPTNCIKTWIIAEQLCIEPLYLKAKTMALMEFNEIKDSASILDFNLKQLYTYLANTNLQCKCEMDVFQECMRWWYENSRKLLESMEEENDFESVCTDTYLCFLSCLNINGLLKSELQEIMAYPDLSRNDHIMNVLHCVADLKQNIKPEYDANVGNKAISLVNSRPRTFKQYPCILVNGITDEHTRKKQKLSVEDVVYHDTFKRKRYYSNIGAPDPSKIILFYDENRYRLEEFLSIDKNKCGNLDGFKIIGYKNLVILLGGEFLIGKGDWNKNVWIYDTIRESWQRKAVPSLMRRHFQLCICDDVLYIVGGTGKFRILQNSMISYKIGEDKLEDEVLLPCTGVHIKCCCWNNKPLLLDLNNKFGYIFEVTNRKWSKLKICDDNMFLEHLVSCDYTVFSYKDIIYIKGNALFELKPVDNTLVVMNYKSFEPVINFDQLTSVVHNNILYTLYKYTSLAEEHNSVVTFERYDLDLRTQQIIFSDVNDERKLEIGNNQSKVKFSMNLFTLGDFYLMPQNDLVNDYDFSLSKIPFVRRHFEFCTCGNYLYIVGGTGQFSVIEDNMFWYNFKDDKWSRKIILPCNGMQIKCCTWKDKLLLLDINNSCGYLFNETNSGWCKLEIHNRNQLVTRFPDKYAAFSYHNNIYIKGDHLIELKVWNHKLIVVRSITLDYLIYDSIDAVVCENVIYTLYKNASLEENIPTLTLEKYNIDYNVQGYIFKDICEGTMVNMGGKEYAIEILANIFTFPHYNLNVNDVFVNDCL